MADFNKKPYASSCKIKGIALFKHDDEEGKPYVNLIAMATQIQYHESLLWPSYGATMVVTDNAENIISSMPIQGFEKVVFEVEDPQGDDYSYEFRIWKIANRLNQDRFQVYTICLISEEGLVNEGVRVNKVVQGTVSDVVSKLLTEYLNAVGGKIDSEPSANGMKMIPTKKSPFALIRSLCTKTISAESFSSKKNSSKKNKNIEEKLPPGVIRLVVEPYEPASGTVSDVGLNADKATGTAGYFFFQTIRGFVFRSIDSLASKKPKGGIFSYSAAKVDGAESMNKIQEIQFTKEIDIFEKMRQGAFSSIVSYFNINTGKYEEHVYSLSSTWDDMYHLGSQTKLPSGQSELSEYPSRVMSTVINHENWYSGSGVASNEDKDLGGEDNKNHFPDWQKQYLSQGISRIGIMFNQQLTISLTGHLELCAGDTIEIRVPNQVPDSSRKDIVWDPEHSGTYLIKSLNHQFDIMDENVYTVLELIRDSYGIKENDSKVK